MRLLVAIDGSTDADRAVALVSGTSWPPGLAVRVVAVAEEMPDWLAMPGEAVPYIDLAAADQRVAADLTTALEAAKATLAKAGLEAEAVLLRGRPSTQIAQEAEAFGADLVVVGSRGRGPFRSMLLGSVSAEVVDVVAAPVLVARSATLGPVIVAEDGSDGARRAVELLLSCPTLVAGGVRVVSVAATPQLSFIGLEPMTAEVADMWAQTRDAVIETSHKLSAATADRFREHHIAVEVATPEGDPAHALVAEAREHGVGLIAMGSRGQTGLTRLVLGSVARNVLLHAPCSVMIVKAPPAVAEKDAGTTAGADH